jgi:hypothetical protein
LVTVAAEERQQQIPWPYQREEDKKKRRDVKKKREKKEEKRAAVALEAREAFGPPSAQQAARLSRPTSHIPEPALLYRAEPRRLVSRFLSRSAKPSRALMGRQLAFGPLALATLFLFPF